MSESPAPVLLAAFAAGVIAVAEAVAWLGRTRSAWLDLVAFVLMGGLLGAIGARLAVLLDEAGERRRRSRRRTAIGAAVAVALLAGGAPLVLPAIARAGLDPPETAVRGYLGALVDGDGITACRYLSQGARAAVERASGHDCQDFFAATPARIGDRTLDSHAQLAGVRYREAGRGRDRIVTMAYDGGIGRFVLVPATRAERQEYLAPPTPWRVASDAGAGAAL